MTNPLGTHEVLNQSPPFEDVNLFTADRALVESVNREGGSTPQANSRLLASSAVRPRPSSVAVLLTNIPRELKAFDARGYRLDLIEYHPAYHECMAISIKEGLHCSAWDYLAQPGDKPVPGSNVARSAGCYMAIQMEAATSVPSP